MKRTNRTKKYNYRNNNVSKCYSPTLHLYQEKDKGIELLINRRIKPLWNKYCVEKEMDKERLRQFITEARRQGIAETDLLAFTVKAPEVLNSKDGNYYTEVLPQWINKYYTEHHVGNFTDDDYHNFIEHVMPKKKCDCTEVINKIAAAFSIEQNIARAVFNEMVSLCYIDRIGRAGNMKWCKKSEGCLFRE